jgi:RNA-binding protein
MIASATIAAPCGAYDMSLDSDGKKHLRRIGHGLTPAVTVASKGFTDPVRAEIERALTDHELIKVRISVAERDQRRELIEAITAATGAELVQAVGRVILLFRKTAQPDPRLSNLLRHGG